MLVLTVLILLFHVINGQVTLPGHCPNVSAVQDFEPSRYLGKWYEYEKYFAIFEAGGKCINAVYSLNENGSIKVVNSRINELTNNPSNITGYATFDGPQTEAKLSVVFPSLPVKIAAPYWVISTDYEKYAVVLSCNQLGILNARILWVLTRDQEPSNETLETVYAFLDENNLSRKYLIKTKQTDCPTT